MRMAMMEIRCIRVVLQIVRQLSIRVSMNKYPPTAMHESKTPYQTCDDMKDYR